MADNILVMRYELKDLAREVAANRPRGSAHAMRVTSFDITALGLVVHE